MKYPILPFCKGNLKNFHFKIVSKILKNDELIVFKVNNYKVNISDVIDNYENCVIFGNYFNKTCVIEKVKNISDSFHHLMGRHFNEEFRTIAGIGISTLKWIEETRYCGICGNKTEFSKKEKNALFCKKCNRFYFPRINPAIIIAVKKEDSILVTRKSEWKPNRYGLVAGFIEYGENIEECAIREVFEETKIKIKNIKYVASQFWPFPYQLMIGLEAEYEDGEIFLDENELAEAKWLKFSELKNDILPPPSSIARFLMERFKSS